MGSVTMFMNVVPPFRLDLTVWALRRRPENIIDRWDGQTYRRVLVLYGKPIELEVRQIGSRVKPRLRVTAMGSGVTSRVNPALKACVERMLGTGIKLSHFYRLTTQQPALRDLVRRFRGVKPPRYPTVHESMLNAFACQQLSLAVGILLLNRLAERYGLAVENHGGRVHAFPRPEDLSDVRPEALRELGFSLQKARAVIEVNQAMADQRLDLESLAVLDEETLLHRLQDLRGVGRWTAEYVSLRGLGRLHVFPGDDVGAQHKLQQYLGLRRAPNYNAVHRYLADWYPYAGLIYFHLLLHGLAAKGYLS